MSSGTLKPTTLHCVINDELFSDWIICATSKPGLNIVRFGYVQFRFFFNQSPYRCISLLLVFATDWLEVPFNVTTKS